MAEQKKNNPKGKTQVRELPKKEKQLNADEQKKIKGGNLLHNIMDGIISNPKK